MKGFLGRRDPRFVLFGLGPEASSWRGVGLLGVVFFGSLIFAAVFTPPAYWLVGWWRDQATSEWSQGTTKWLLDKGVDVYFDRLRWVPILAGLPWLMSGCHLWSWRALGLGRNKSAAQNLGAGIIGGWLLVAALAGLQMAFTNVQKNPGVNWPALAVNAVLAGLILGFLEEIIFRGLVLRIFYTATRRPWLALAAMAALFAYMHFKVPGSVWTRVAPGVHGSTGFFVAYWTMAGIAVEFDPAQFASLWLLGLVLGALVLKTGSLWPAIGLHSGLVMAMAFYRGACVFPASDGRAFWGGGGLTDGWAAVIFLLLIFFAIVWSGVVAKNSADEYRS